MSRITIKAPAKKDYEVIIEQGFSQLSNELTAVGCLNKKVCIISDANVWQLYGKEVSDVFTANECSVDQMILEPGEVSKASEDLLPCYKELLKKAFTRGDYIVSLGGGVVTDYAGFVAATFKCGTHLIHIPTSLMAMVSGSIGGKCGVDLDEYKNMIGAYYTPDLVFINTECIETLEDVQYYSGFAEVMKVAIVKSSSVYEWLIDNLYEITDKDKGIVTDMIEQTINLEKIYIDKDPYNTSDRIVLDLGHTIGHALEKAKNYTLAQGECIALGIIAAAHISLKRQMLSLDEYLEIRDMFVPFNLPITIEDIDIDKVINDIRLDMCSNDKGAYIILLKKIGKAVPDYDVTDEELREALKELLFTEDDMKE